MFISWFGSAVTFQFKRILKLISFRFSKVLFQLCNRWRFYQYRRWKRLHFSHRISFREAAYGKFLLSFQKGTLATYCKNHTRVRIDRLFFLSSLTISFLLWNSYFHFLILNPPLISWISDLDWHQPDFGSSACTQYPHINFSAICHRDLHFCICILGVVIWYPTFGILILIC